MHLARRLLVLDHTWFGTLALRLEIIADPSTKTAATDGISLWFNPEWFDPLNRPKQLGVTMHEVLHCALGHMWRIEGRDPDIAQEAADHVVNLIIKAIPALELPEPHYADPRFVGMAFEKVYTILADEKAKRQQQSMPSKGAGQGVSNEINEVGSKKEGAASKEPPKATSGATGTCGQSPLGDSGNKSGNKRTPRPRNRPGPQSGSGAPGPQTDQSPNQASNVGNRLKGGITAAPGLNALPGPSQGPKTGSLDPANWGVVLVPDPVTKTEPKEVAREWEKAVEIATLVTEKAGLMPNHLRVAVKEAKVSTEDLTPVLQDYLTTKGGCSYSHTNKRFISRGLHLPGPVKSRMGTVLIAVDTSGSTTQLLNLFASKANEVLLMDEFPEKIVIVYCDAKVQAVEFTDDCIDFRPVGGGDTLFQPVLDWVEQEQLSPDVCIWLTDLYAYDLGHIQEPGYPVLFVAPFTTRATAPFGRTVLVDPYQV